MTYTIHTYDKKTTGRKFYCGPTVLKLLTGKTRKEVEASINRYINKQYAEHRGRVIDIRGDDGSYHYHRVNIEPNKIVDQVVGMHSDHMTGVLKKMKFNPELVRDKPNMTLKTFVEDRQFMPHPTVAVLNTHYVLAYKGVVYDTKNPRGCPVKDHYAAGKRVCQYINIKKRSRL